METSPHPDHTRMDIFNQYSNLLQMPPQEVPNLIESVKQARSIYRQDPFDQSVAKGFGGWIRTRNSESKQEIIDPEGGKVEHYTSTLLGPEEEYTLVREKGLQDIAGRSNSHEVAIYTLSHTLSEDTSHRCRIVVDKTENKVLKENEGLLWGIDPKETITVTIASRPLDLPEDEEADADFSPKRSAQPPGGTLRRKSIKIGY